MKITQETELKYGMACKVCQEQIKEHMEESKMDFYIGCPYRHIDNEYCDIIEKIEKEKNHD